MPFVHVGGHRLEYERIDAGGGGRSTLVLLHEGLGSISMWRDFPRHLAHAASSPVVVYSRHGHGNSDPLTAPRTVRYLHDEADVALPAFLDALAIDCPILVGHSDGGSIALLHAASGARDVAGVVALAPHVRVEDISVASIAAARDAYAVTTLREKLARHHADGDGVFWRWNDIWLSPEFRAWNIEDCLPRIACPILAIQGEDDEYGTMDQLARIARGARDVEIVALADCRHALHRDQPDALVEAIARFVGRVSAA
ncbi:MAG: alpha/beta hydrolase [Casimicrobiaceae bacterium]